MCSLENDLDKMVFALTVLLDDFCEELVDAFSGLKQTVVAIIASLLDFVNSIWSFRFDVELG